MLIFFVLSVLLEIVQSCQQTCYQAYTDGSHKSAEVLEGSPTIVPINFTGVVTVEAAYIPGYKAQWEYIRFMKNESQQPLVMQFYTPQRDYLTTLSIFAEDERGAYSASRYSAFSLFNRKNDDIIIQVSDVHVAEDNFYRIYLGEPGNAHSRNYNYQNQENWEDLSFMRFNTTTQIKTDNRAIFFKSVSVCSDDSPVLCGDSVETIAVSRGESFNLSCSVYGAPYLEAVWSDFGFVRRKPTFSVDGFFQTTTISIGSFSGNDMGVWTCFWRNKNLETVSNTKTFHVVELVSKPLNTTFVQNQSKDQVFKWMIQNKRPIESPDEFTISLDCEQGNFNSSADSEIPAKDSFWISVLTHFEENSVLSEHSATLILPEEVKSDNITCSLYLVSNSGEKLGVLDTTTLYREGYHCEEGYYGVGEECLVCPENFTSSPRSTECFPLEVDVPVDQENVVQIVEQKVVSVTVSYEEKKELEDTIATNINVRIGVIVGIIILLALSVSLVAFTIHVAKRLECI